MSGIALIAAERERQISVEGWTPEHDDEHDNEELALAACYYALPSDQPVYLCDCVLEVDDLYPGEWSEAWMKRSDDTIRNLVKAGALIAAEIDRLQRKAGEGK